MARRASEENETDLPGEVEWTPRISKRVEYSDDDDSDSNNGDDDDRDDGDDDDDDDDDDNDYSSNKQENETSQSKHTAAATPSDVIQEKSQPQSKSRIKKIKSKIGSVLSKKKPKSDPSSEAAFNKLRRKIQELEDEKAVFQSKMEQMEFEKCSEREAVVKERDDLRAEITKLQSRIEDLTILKEKAESNLEKYKERETVATCNDQRQVSGWLWKRGVRGPTGRLWRRRWFLSQINDHRLYYYCYSNQLIPRGFIDIQKITEVKDLPSDEQNNEKSCFNVVTPARTYEIKAKDEQEKLEWIDALDHLMYWINRQGSCNEGTAIPSTKDLENN